MYSRSILFLLVVLLTLTTVLGGQAPSFIARRDFLSAGNVQPVSIAVADLNGDGIPDMVAGGFGALFVSVFLGNGDGTFQPHQDFPSGVNGTFVAVSDFNGDGILDVVVAGGNSIAVLLGNGDGTFQPFKQFATGTNADFIAVGDFNGDSIPDLAVTNRGNSSTGQGSSVSVLLGNGDGTFSAATNYDVGIGPSSVTIVDVNNDGIADLVVANTGANSGPDGTLVPDNRLSILYGQGDGTFSAALHLQVGTGPMVVVNGDFNRDGNSDLAVILLKGADSNQGSVQVLFGDGNGDFSDGGAYPVPSPHWLALGDMNGDGVLDLLVSNQSGLLSVLLGNGDGSFKFAPDVPVADGLGSFVTLADLNGDGVTDIALTTGARAVSVIIGNGDGTFQTAASPLPGRTGITIVTADFNQDGNPDIAFSGLDPTDPVTVLLGNGDGTFQPAQTFSPGQSPNLFAATDLNGDGLPDLVLTIGGQLAVMLGNGDGTFQSPTNLGAGTFSVAVADVNGDGIPDLVASSNPNVSGSPALVFLGNGDGTFQSPTSLGIVARFVTVGDFNVDGHLDIALTSGTSNMVSILMGNGDGTFQSPVQSSIPQGTPFRLAVGDFNHDGIPDLALTLSSQPNPNDLVVMLGHGDGTFDDPVGYIAGGAFGVAVGDANGDGIPDLIVNSGQSVGVLTGNGDGGFQPAVLFGPGGFAMAVADFNNDGKPDAAISDSFIAGHGLSLLMNNHP